MIGGLQTSATAAPSWLAEDVRRSLTLTPRQLPARALYDDLGSALFDAICWLPWYPVTRAECRLLDAHGGAMLDAAGGPNRLAELGCGNGDKLRRLLISGRTAPRAPGRWVTHIDLIDVSSSALVAGRAALSAFQGLSVEMHPHPYESGLVDLSRSRSDADRLCVAFLGSSIGNFDPTGMRALLDTIRGSVRPLDSLLLGVDLVKPQAELLAAYDDPLGLTAAFNKNLLVRLNRELGANFDIGGFAHRAVWDVTESRMEMHLVSTRRQRVDVPGADLSIELRADEHIWTESSYKFRVDDVERRLRSAGFEPVRRWIDGEGQFLLVVALAQ